MEKNLNGLVSSSGEDIRMDGIEVVKVEKRATGEANESEEATEESQKNAKLGWRSWMVVAVVCFANMVQIFVVVAAGSVISFIIRDLGEAPLSGWIVQAPLLMQAALSPIFGRLSDIVDRKSLITITPLFALVGAIISAKAENMTILIIGGVLIGVPLGTSGILLAIPAEVLPNKYRPIASGLSFITGAIGSLIGSLGAGAVTNLNPSGWRNIFWIQTAFHAITTLSLLLFYHPKSTTGVSKMSYREIIWACDPIGSGLFISGTTLSLMALDWTGGAFPWSDAHVVGPLTLGLLLLVAFGLYEWRGRPDGIVAHVFFVKNWNFAISIFAFTIEGWIFYSAVNSITPQLVLNLGFESSSWSIAIRQLSYSVTAPIAAVPMIWYATKTKDLKYPLIFSFLCFLVVSICYATITPAFKHAQIAYNVIAAIGQAGPLTLLVSLFQFASPHAYISTATGLAISFRAMGGAFGSAVLLAIINGHLSSKYSSTITSTATSLGLPRTSVPALLSALAAGDTDAVIEQKVPGIDSMILEAVVGASRGVYAEAYRLAWSSIIPFVVLAVLAIAGLKGVRELMTERIEATVEKVGGDEEGK